MNNLRGALLMILSMGLFAVQDMFIKLASADLPIGQILLILGLGGSAVFAVAVKATGQKLVPAALLQPVVLTRNASELIGSFGFMTALALTPISSASSILQALPLAVALMAAIFLGEQVGVRRWAAIAVGFIGVLLIVRPGTSGFEPYSLFAVLGVLGLAARDLTTRIAPPAMSTPQLAQWGFAMMIPLGAVMLPITGGAHTISGNTVWHLAAMIGAGVAAYYLIVVSLRISDLSAIASFRYSRLIFALIIGFTVFGERPDTFTLAGASLIIASGLYALARERALFSEALEG